MEKTKTTVLTVLSVTSLLALVAFGGAQEEDETTKNTFETCLDELNKAVTSSTDVELGTESVTTVSLEASIRIFDECLNREGVTLSIHGSLGEGTGASSGTAAYSTGSASSNSGNQLGNLESSLHEFDSRLSQIQEEIKTDSTEPPARQNSEEELTDLEEVTGEATQETNSTAVVSAEAKHETTEKRVPLDPKDEDIILKTVREAAELETDPTTRQALWDQYYDYADKNN